MWSGIAAGAMALGGALISSNASGKAAGAQSEATDKAISADNAKFQLSRSDLAPYRQAGQAALSRLSDLLGIGAGAPDKSQFQTGSKRVLVPVTHDNFDAGGYLEANPDIAEAAKGIGGGWFGGDPYNHFSKIGYTEGRKQYLDQPIYDEAAYADALQKSQQGSPLLRKFAQSDLDTDPVYQSGLEFGASEGRKAIERRAAATGSYDSGQTLKELTRFGNDYGSTKANESYGRFRDFQDSSFGKLAGIAGMGSGATNVGVGANTAAGTNLANLYTGQGNANAAANIASSNAITGGINNAMGYYYLNKLSGGGQRTAAPSSPALDLTGGE